MKFLKVYFLRHVGEQLTTIYDPKDENDDGQFEKYLDNLEDMIQFLSETYANEATPGQGGLGHSKGEFDFEDESLDIVEDIVEHFLVDQKYPSVLAPNEISLNMSLQDAFESTEDSVEET